MADSPAIALAAVTRRFGGLAAVRGVTLEVPAGQRRAILGPNGAGKTTLFNVICGDFPPSEGRIALFGEDVSRLPAWRRARRGIGRTYQTSMPFAGLSVRQNLFVAVRGAQPRRFSALRPRRDDAAMQAAAHAAQQVRIAHLLDRRAAELSHGQRRQLEIGMPLAQNPRLLILDEPSEGLAPVIVAHLGAVLAGLAGQGMRILLVEQKLAIAARVCPEVAVMLNGRIAARMPAQALLADAALQARHLGVARGGH
jgi:branched-chain amino acid transport system ATP-binding protein